MQDNLKSHRIFGYKELVPIHTQDNQESLTDVRTYDPSIIAHASTPDMQPYTGEDILVRDELATRLASANASLAERGFRLKVVYGYRHPKIQKRYFEKRKNELRQQYPKLNDEDLNALTHGFVAVPSVGGHPAGGAVDLTVVNSAGEELDMGTHIADFSHPKTIQTFASGLTAEQERNRQLLHDAMVAAGFAPFYGEWWHFCYGDREWAAMYGKDSAIYGQIEL